MTEPEIIANGLSAKQWIDLLHGDQQSKSKKALNYLDGAIEQEVEKVLNDPHKGRTEWRTRGVIPRYRNLTSMIIEKSGPLFNDSLPAFRLFDKQSNEVNQAETEKLHHILSSISLHEILINDDQVRRLLKASVWLVQYDTQVNQLVIETLHRANCGVMTDFNRNITGLIYATSDVTYRIFTPTTIIDLMVDPGAATIHVTSEVENPFGIVPAGFVYDTKLPRAGVWPESESSLINFNEAYNLHLTESEFTMRWMLNPTMIMVDCNFDDEAANYTQEVLNYGDTLPRSVNSAEITSGGPGVILGVASNGSGSAKVEYIGPSVAIEPIDKVYEQWSQQIAADYSVRLTPAGTGSATSGFQLVVEEIPNLELRKQRQRMFENSLKRIWPVMRTVLNTSTQQVFDENTELFVEFSHPRLPVNALEQEQLWTTRITSNRASVIDYFMTEYNMSREEAEIKIEEIIAVNRRMNEYNP